MDLSLTKMKKTEGAETWGETQVYIKFEMSSSIQVEEKLRRKLEYTNLEFRKAVRLEMSSV